MSGDQTPQARRGWTYRGFLIGVAIGAVVGLLTVDMWDGKGGPTQAPTSVGFWGLLGGAVGSLVGVALQRR